jgi:cytochrome c-type biogenesis protein CcmF
MNQIGYVSLMVAFAVSLYGALALGIGAAKGHPELIKSGRRAAWATTGLISLSSFALIFALMTDDFSLKYVVENSARAMDWFYKFSAMWGGQEGSLLLWAWMLALFMIVVLFQTRQPAYRQVGPWVLVTMMTGVAFFIAMCGIVTNVFQPNITQVSDGRGLNPLLQNPGMVIHPPMLYAGYVSTIAAAGFAFAALVVNRLDNSWIRFSRRWILSSWIFLTVGNFLGGQWAYVVLSFGGFWAWDPVENAAIMPWFINTALMHSIMIQQRRGMFKIWNISLAFLAYGLSLFGTFLTRSGILSSVHAFGESTLGIYFMVWIGVLLMIGFGYVFLRLPQLKSENKLDGLISRETSFLLNNILFFLCIIFILWGTLSPLANQIFGGEKVETTADYYPRTMYPVLLGVLFLMGIGPLIAWRRASLESISRSFWIPASAGLGFGLIAFGLGMRQFLAFIGLSICVFTATTVFLDFYRGIRTRRKHGDPNVVVAVKNMTRRNGPRYGGLLVHLGILMISAVIIVSSVYEAKIDYVELKVGESVTIKGIHEYKLTMESANRIRGDLKTQFPVNLALTVDGKPDGYVTPAVEYYPSIEQFVTVVHIRATLLEDLWITTGQQEIGADNKIISAPFHILVRPMMLWAWVGLALTIIGLLVAIWPNPNEQVVQVPSKTGKSSGKKEVAQVN